MSGEIRRIVVVGAGTMGRQIVAVLAHEGLDLTLTDRSPEVLANAAAWLRTSPHVGSATWRTAEDPAVWLASADLVIEAVAEDVEVKRSVFAWLAAAAPSATLASNSSSMPVAWFAGDADLARMLNVHFYVRPWERRVVEIMTSGSTSDEVLGATASLLRRCELQVFTLRTVSIGLLYNRIWAAIKREALAIVDEGVATPAEVDDIVRQLDPAPARGPFERMDDVGLDTVRDIEGVYSARFGWARSALLRKLVESGRTGRKSGAGFFRYPTQH